LRFPALIESPRLYARIGGVLYLFIIVLGFFAEGLVADRLIVAGDAAASAHNIMASLPLWNWSVAANLIVPVLAVPLLLIEYWLLRPAGKGWVQLALVFNVVSLAVECVSKLFLLAVTVPLSASVYLDSFNAHQREALAFLALKWHDIAFNISLIFFGCTLIIYGIVIFSSRYLPRFLGVLLPIAGASYILACLAALFAPGLYNLLFPYILLPPLIGEASFCLWLLLKGVNVGVWTARAAQSAVPD
jgi:Domain of unknown function (DUF4386)